MPEPVPLPDKEDTEAARRRKMAMQYARSSGVNTVLTDKTNQPLGG